MLLCYVVDWKFRILENHWQTYHFSFHKMYGISTNDHIFTSMQDPICLAGDVWTCFPISTKNGILCIYAWLSTPKIISVLIYPITDIFILDNSLEFLKIIDKLIIFPSIKCVGFQQMITSMKEPCNRVYQPICLPGDIWSCFPVSTMNGS